jgi:hypothetical protein
VTVPSQSTHTPQINDRSDCQASQHIPPECLDWLDTVTSIKRSLIVVHLGLCVDWIGTVTSIKVDCLITVDWLDTVTSVVYLGGMGVNWLDTVTPVVYLGRYGA